MKQIRLAILFFIIAFISGNCLKAKRSFFDFSTPSGTAIANAYLASNTKIIISTTTPTPTPTTTQTISFPTSSYSLSKNVPISAITPTLSATASACASNQSLPPGLSLNATTCAISGTPTALQSSTVYTISAIISFFKQNMLLLFFHKSLDFASVKSRLWITNYVERR